MTNKPCVSVIVPVYNSARYLEECIESIISQTYEMVEIVLSDDASDDNSAEILKDYKRKYPKKIKLNFQEKNVGVSKNRHDAIVISTGDYITTLDSDDIYLSPKKIEKEVYLIREHLNERGKDVIAFSGTERIGENSEIMKFSSGKKVVREGNIFKYVLSRKCMMFRDPLMSRKVYFNVGGYDIERNLYEDWDLKIRLAAQYEMYYTGEVGTGYRQNKKGLSRRTLKDNLTALIQVFNKNRRVGTLGEKIYAFYYFSLLLIKFSLRNLFWGKA